MALDLAGRSSRVAALAAVSCTAASCAQLAGVEPWQPRDAVPSGGSAGADGGSSSAGGEGGALSACGNGSREDGEDCDDGDEDDGDGCDTSCHRRCDGPESDDYAEDPSTGHCYRLRIVEQANWAEAEVSCQDWSGHLVTITSLDEQTLVQGLHRGTTALDPWIGASDGGSEGKYVWVTGEPFQYTAWAAGQPNGEEIADEDCVLLVIESQLLWHDAACYLPRSWICERSTGL